jgi:hypothetical protein
MYCDLHMHSTASDGTASPTELAALAKRAGLGAIALTDHDTTAGLVECEAACRKAKIKFVPGIELSADPMMVGSATGGASAAIGRRGTMHILGLFIRHDDPALDTIQETLHQARADRNPQIIANLNKLGVRITYDDVIAEAKGQVIGRPHIASVLLRKGYVKSMQDAFTRYIGEGAAAYARKDRLAAADAVAVIHQAGGLALLAHPVQLRCEDDDALHHVVRRLKDVGLDGIETRHSDHRPADVERLEKLAADLNLLTTGGSDYHGSRKSIELGSERVPMQVYEALERAKGRGPRAKGEGPRAPRA